MVTEVAYQKIFARKYDKLKYGGAFVKYWYAIIGSGVLNVLDRQPEISIFFHDSWHGNCIEMAVMNAGWQSFT